MHRTISTSLALVLVLTAPLLAQSKAEDAYVRGFFEEKSTRDFAKAEKLYAEAAAEAEKEQKGDIAAKAGVGRIHCLMALGREAEARDAVKDLGNRFPDDPSVRSTMAELESRPADATAMLITALLNRMPEPSAKLELVALQDRALPHLKPLIEHATAELARKIASVYAEQQTPASLAELVAMASDPRLGVAEAALISARRLTTETDARFAIIEAGLRHVDPRINGMACDVLAESRTTQRKSLESRVAELAAMALTHRTGSVRQRALAWIGDRSFRIPTSTVETSILAALNSAEIAERTLALHAARAAMGGPDVTPTIEDSALRHAAVLLDNDDRSVRMEAAGVFGQYPRSWPQDVADLVHQGGLRSLKDGVDTWLRGETEYRVAWNTRATRTLSPEQMAGWLKATASAIAPSTEERVRGGIGSMVQSMTQIVARNLKPEEFERWVLELLPSLAPGQCRAALAHAVLGQDRASDAIRVRLLEESDPKVRMAAYGAANRGAGLTTPQPLPRFLLEDLASLDLELASRAHEFADHVRDPALIPALRARKPQDDGDRAHDLALMVEIAGATVLPDVRAFVAKSRAKKGDPPFAVIAAAMVTRIGDGAVEDLVRMAESAGAASVPWAMVGGRAGADQKLDGSVMRAFVARVPKRLIDARFLERFYEVSPADAAAATVVALEAADRRMLSAIARFAGERCVFAAAPRLVALLDDQDPGIQATAQDALTKLRERRRLKDEFGADGGDARGAALDAAQKLLKSEKPIERRAAAFAFGALGDATAVGSLLELVQDQDPSVSAAASDALERIGGRMIATRQAATSRPSEPR